MVTSLKTGSRPTANKPPLASLDVETVCSAPGCDGFIYSKKLQGSRVVEKKKPCKHALQPHTSRITVIGLYTQNAGGIVFRSIDDLKYYLEEHGPFRLGGHSFRFDLKKLAYDGLDLTGYWDWDSAIEANICHTKVPERYRWKYEMRRRKLGAHHRKAKGNSLKVLAPYFLKVPPFWETADHDDDGYVLKDAEYALRLHLHFERLLREQDQWGFYRKHAIKDARMLLAAERRGVLSDLKGLAKYKDKAAKEAAELEQKMATQWAQQLVAKRENEIRSLKQKYVEMAAAYCAKHQGCDAKKVVARYDSLFKNARDKLEAVPFNFDSATQLKWLLKDALGYNVCDANGDESTKKAVLNRLARKHEDVSVLLKYKVLQKQLQAFLPTYEMVHDNGIIRPSFHLDTVRTGRTSSSDPNMQQVPPVLRPLVVVARPGMRLVDYDASAIEAKVIAFFSEDPMLYQAVKPGQDFHGYNVANIYFPGLCAPNDVKKLYPDERAFAKRLGYALFYGARWRRVQHVSYDMGFNWKQGRCKEVVENFDAHYAGVFEYKQSIDDMAMRGNPVPTLFGRAHYYADPEDVTMKAFNTSVQFAASEMLLLAMRRTQAWMRSEKIGGYVALVVHDEGIIEVVTKHAKRVAERVQQELTRFNFNTVNGPITLECEGAITKRWEK